MRAVSLRAKHDEPALCRVIISKADCTLPIAKSILEFNSDRFSPSGLTSHMKESPAAMKHPQTLDITSILI